MTSERETPNTDALLPCPFCGSSQLREGIHCFGHGDYSKTVECDCGARMADYYGDSYAKWNTRTPAPSVTSEEWRSSVFSWQWWLISAACISVIAGITGYYLDRGELICIRLEK